MRYNVFRLKRIELITGKVSEIRIGDTWKIMPFCDEIQIMQLFTGDCSEHDVMATDGRFYRSKDLSLLVSREFKK